MGYFILGFLSATLLALAAGFRFGFYSGCFEILNRATTFDKVVQRHGNSFIREEWLLFIKAASPNEVNAKLFSHIKRILKIK